MKKYLQILKMSWQNTLTYRLNFLMWRVRQVFLLLGSYFFWLAIYQSGIKVGSYNSSNMLTYIVLVSILNALIFSSRSHQVASDIGSGNLNNYLVRPVNYFVWMFFLDLGDKVSNALFLIIELSIFFLVLKPPFFIQTNGSFLLLFLISILIGLVMYFFFSLIISTFTFWYPEHNGWPIRFLFDIFLVFLSGGWFPLDILPKTIYKFLEFLPFSYLRFFPAKIYLGQIDFWQIISGLGLMLFWTAFLIWLAFSFWKKGLKNYAAEGI